MAALELHATLVVGTFDAARQPKARATLVDALWRDVEPRSRWWWCRPSYECADMFLDADVFFRMRYCSCELARVCVRVRACA